MAHYFEYLDSQLYCHHSIHEKPVPSEFTMHLHERLELYLFISGDALEVVEGFSYPLHPFDVIITRSAENHYIQIQSEQVYERIAICFDSELFRSIDPEGILLRPFFDRPLGRNNQYTLDPELQRLMLTYFRKITPDCSNARKRLHIFSAVLILLQHLSQQFEPVDTVSQDGSADEPARRLLHYINDHLFDDISLVNISSQFFLSQSQLNRIFRKATGASIWEYVRSKRLLAAREKILAGESAMAACTKCGFQDYSSFYRAYRSRFGTAPSKTIQLSRKHVEAEKTDWRYVLKFEAPASE